MTNLTFTIVREPSIKKVGVETFTPGTMYRNGVRFCFTCEDEDRRLESGFKKIKGLTAIPRGKYQLTTSFSNRFQKELPEVVGVPDYSGVRIHGGNVAEDSSGCILVGHVRSETGISKCAETVRTIIDQINRCESMGEKVYLEVK